MAVGSSDSKLQLVFNSLEYQKQREQSQKSELT